METRLTINNLKIKISGKFNSVEMIKIFSYAASKLYDETGAVWDIFYGSITDTNWTQRQAKKHILAYLQESKKRFSKNMRASCIKDEI